MIDLETLSTKKTAAIISIGAVFFDQGGLGSEFKANIKRGSVSFFDTEDKVIRFWENQSPEALRGLEDPSPITITEALHSLSEFLGYNSILWGKGAFFDNAILHNAYCYCGIPFPVFYRDHRCYRTIRSIFKGTEPPVVNLHDSLEDAKWQALHLINILKENSLALN